MRGGEPQPAPPSVGGNEKTPAVRGVLPGVSSARPFGPLRQPMGHYLPWNHLRENVGPAKP
jgi:hypothetical protein